MLLNLIVGGVYFTLLSLVSADKKDEHVSGPNSDEEPDIPESFDRLYGINSTFHANKSHLTSESLGIEAVFPSSSSSSEDRKKITKLPTKKTRKTRKSVTNKVRKSRKTQAHKTKSIKAAKVTHAEKLQDARKTDRYGNPISGSKISQAKSPIPSTTLKASESSKESQFVRQVDFYGNPIIRKTSSKPTLHSIISSFRTTTNLSAVDTSTLKVSTEASTKLPSALVTTIKPTMKHTLKTTVTSEKVMAPTHKQSPQKQTDVTTISKLTTVSSSIRISTIPTTVTSDNEADLTTTQQLESAMENTALFPVDDNKVHIQKNIINQSQENAEYFGTKNLGAHPIWDILRTTRSTTDYPEPNVPRLNIRRKKKMPLKFKPPPQGWPGIDPTGNSDEFKIMEPEYTFRPFDNTTRGNMWNSKVAVTNSLAQEIAKKYQMMSKKPFAPYVHSPQKDRVYSYRNASGYFIYVRERPTYFPTKPTSLYGATYRYKYQPPKRYDWKNSAVQRAGLSYILHNATQSRLNTTYATLPPRYTILPQMPYYAGQYYPYPKAGLPPQHPPYPPAAPSYRGAAYPPYAPPPPPQPPRPYPQYPVGQPYPPPYPQPPRQPPPPPPPYAPRPPYPPPPPPPPPYPQAVPYPRPQPPPPPPPPPPRYPQPYQSAPVSPYQPKPVYQTPYRPQYPPPPPPPPPPPQSNPVDGYDYNDPNYKLERPGYSGPIKGFPLPSPRIMQPRPYYIERRAGRSNFTLRSTSTTTQPTKSSSFIARTMFPFIPRGTYMPPGVRHTMLPPSAWRRNKTFTYLDAFNRGFGRIRPLAYGKRVTNFGHVPVHELGPPPPKVGESYAGNLTTYARNTSRTLFGYEPYKPKFAGYRGGFGYEPYRAPRKYDKKPTGPDYVPYRPYRNKFDRLSLKEYVPYKPFRKDRDDDYPSRFSKGRFSVSPRPTRSYTYPPRRDVKKSDFTRDNNVFVYGEKEPDVKEGLAAYLSEAQLKRMGKGKTLADMFADFFPPSTMKTKSNRTKSTVSPRKLPSLNQEVTELPEEETQESHDGLAELEELANKMVIKEKPTPKPRGMTAREAMRAAAREAQREMEMEDMSGGGYRKRFSLGSGRPPPFIRRGGARGSGRPQYPRDGGGGDRWKAAGVGKKKRKKNKKKEKSGKKRSKRSFEDSELDESKFILIGNRRANTFNAPSSDRHQLTRGKGRPITVFIRPRSFNTWR